MHPAPAILLEKRDERVLSDRRARFSGHGHEKPKINKHGLHKHRDEKENAFRNQESFIEGLITRAIFRVRSCFIECDPCLIALHVSQTFISAFNHLEHKGPVPF